MGSGRGRGGDEDDAEAMCGLCTCMWTIIFMFLLGFSFKVVAPLEMGIRYSNNLVQLRCDENYENALVGHKTGTHGRYFTGLGETYKTFPTTIFTVLMSGEAIADRSVISGRSKDGVPIEVSISLQYRLERSVSGLCNLYRQYGTDGGEQEYIEKFTRAIVRDVVSHYKVMEFFGNRTAMGEAMANSIRTTLKTRVYCDLIGFQLLEMNLPMQIKAAIENTQVAKQRIVEAEYSRQAELELKKTSIESAEYDVQKIAAIATGVARKTEIEANATAEAYKLGVNAESSAFSALKAKMAFTTNELLDYIWLISMEKRKAASTIFEVPKPEFIE